MVEMKFVLLFLSIISSVVSLKSIEEISAQLTKNLDNLYPSHETPFDDLVSGAILRELLTVTNSSELSECEKCVTRLEIGKFVSATRPDLVPDIWTKWCIESEYDDKLDCQLDFGRMTVANMSTGTNFVNMLTLMDPLGYDGQLYCYYKESKACPLPETPEVDISYMWPKKELKHYIAPTPGNETINVLHISDFHLELSYTVGAEANCTDNSMCCTEHNYNEDEMPSGYNFTDAFSDSDEDQLSYYDSSYVEGEFVKGDFVDVFNDSSIWYPANTFGNYFCDAPEILVNSSLKSIAEYQKSLGLDFEFAIFTGDLVDHDELQYQSVETVVKEEEYMFRDIKYRLDDIPLFATLGNHDNYPYGQIAQEDGKFDNLFNWNAELLTELWLDYDWISEQELQEAAKHYTLFTAKAQKGLKVISLNSNTWYTKNFYGFWNATNPDSFGTFQFLVDELVKSEQADERVWIIAHIPFIGEALPVHAKLFTQIVERFSPYTIAGIFFGHTHMDQFNLLYAPDSNKTSSDVIANAWITHAVTPWIQYNPAWRYYTVDTETFQVMNSYNYFTKLNETFANDGAEPEWEFEYSAREAYNISWPETSPLNASYWHLVAEQIKGDIDVNQKFVNYEARFSPYTVSCADDESVCLGNWCYLTSFTFEERTKCEKANNVSFEYPTG